jgi:alkylation response protein AidB-like acyl-CoA dehydrogenase
MDFAFTEEQLMIRDLARGILGKEVTPERLKALPSRPEWFDRRLWSTLAEAGLLGIAVPVAAGGMGFGIEELCMLLQEIGRTVAPLPAVPALVLGALPIAAFGTARQQAEWLAPLARGETILTGAFADRADAPAVTLRRDGDGWILDGKCAGVPAVDTASRVLIPAAGGDGTGIFLVDPRARGITAVSRRTTTGEPRFAVRLAGVRGAPDDVLGGALSPDDEQIRWVHERALVAACATQVGVSERALELTGAFVRERIQFGVPIGSFQAVQHRLADGYIDLEAMRWVTWRAACKLARNQPATREVMVAKVWIADGGSRIANAAQHLHGGIGADVDYPIHRYFVWSKALELELGGATEQLVRLGRDMARTGPAHEGP